MKQQLAGLKSGGGEINPDDINFTQKITFSTSIIFLSSFVFEIIMDLKETAEITERAHVSFIRLPWVIASSVPTVLYQTQ